MKVGEPLQLYRSCWSLLLIGIMTLFGARAIGAQGAAPYGTGVSGHHEAGSPAMSMEADESGWNLPRQIHAIEANDSVINPGARDFLEPNVPNPFGVTNDVTRIAFSVSEEGPVVLRVYDFFYNEVVTLFDGVAPAGRSVIIFNPPPTMPTGMYFYELKTDRTRELRRMMYVK